MKREREESTPARAGQEEGTPPVEGAHDESEIPGGTLDPQTSGGDDAETAKPSKRPSPDQPPVNTETSEGVDVSGTAASGATGSSTVTSSLPVAKSVAVAVAAPAAAVAASAVVEVEAEAGAGAQAARSEPSPPEAEGVPNETLFVGNLSYRVSEAVIIKLFTPYGKVVREQFCYHMVGPRRGEPRGFCFVEYSNVEEAAKAILALHGRKLYGRPLRVRFMTVEGRGRMDYSTNTRDGGKGSTSFGVGYGDSGGAKIPPPAGAGGEAGVGAGVTKLSLDKKVALLKLKLRDASKSGT